MPAFPSRKSRAIATMVALEYGLEAEHMFSRSRSKALAEARGIAMYLARGATHRSYPELAADFARIDHTIVMSAIRKVGHRLDADSFFRAKVWALAERMGELTGVEAA